jgi:hypothetical protein
MFFRSLYAWGGDTCSASNFRLTWYVIIKWCSLSKHGSNPQPFKTHFCIFVNEKFSRNMVPPPADLTA